MSHKRYKMCYWKERFRINIGGKKSEKVVHFTVWSFCLKVIFILSLITPYVSNYSVLLYFFLACPDGKFGADCKENCNCPQNQKCDPISGQCFCKPGFNGANCDKRKYYLK